MNDDNIRHLWSDAELDDAFAALHPHVRTDDGELDRARATLLRAASAVSGARTAPPVKKRPGAWRWIAVAAAVAVLTGGVIVARELTGPSQSVLPASTPTADNRPAAGQYTHVTNNYTVIQWVNGRSAFTVRERLEVWIPHGPRELWKRRWTRTGQVTQFVGTPADRTALPGPASVVQTAPDGSFTEALPGSAGWSAGPRGWYQPYPEFIAGLPTDPGKLLAQINQVAKTSPAHLGPVPLFEPIGTPGDGSSGNYPPHGPFAPPAMTSRALPPPTNVSEQTAGLALSVLTSGLAPRPLRDALVQVIDWSSTQVSHGESGAPTNFVLNLADHQLIIVVDPATATVLRASTVAPSPGKYGFPPGQAISSSEYSYDITDNSGG